MCPSIDLVYQTGVSTKVRLPHLDLWAEKETQESWRLDRQKALQATEKGHDIAELRAFLQAREEQPLPKTVESFVKTVQRQGRALKRVGTALLIYCEDAEVAALIAMHKETTGLCLRAGDHHLWCDWNTKKNSGNSFIYWTLVWRRQC